MRHNPPKVVKMELDENGNSKPCKKKKGPAKGSKYVSYTENDKAIALALVDSYGGNVAAAARQLGINYPTVLSWVNRGVNHAVRNRLYPEKRQELAQLFERVARTYLGHALTEEVVSNTKGQAAVSSAAIAIDKLQLLTGKPTNIIANQELTDEQLFDKLHRLAEKYQAISTRNELGGQEGNHLLDGPDGAKAPPRPM